MRKPQSLSELNPSPYNPRAIKSKAAKGLARSLEKYGDIAGITYNIRTNRLICGHQRVDQLARAGAVINNGDIVAANGELFAVRYVDWPEEKEKEANIIANNQAIEGHFIPEVDVLLDEIKNDIDKLDYELLGFDDCRVDFEEKEKSDETKLIVDCSNQLDLIEKKEKIESLGIECREG